MEHPRYFPGLSPSDHRHFSAGSGRPQDLARATFSFHRSALCLCVRTTQTEHVENRRPLQPINWGFVWARAVSVLSDASPAPSFAPALPKNNWQNPTALEETVRSFPVVALGDFVRPKLSNVLSPQTQ